MRPSMLLVLALVVAVTGCDAGNPPTTPGPDPQSEGESPPTIAESPEVPQPQSPAAQPPTATEGGGGGRPESPFGRRETAVGGVAEFLEAVPGGGIAGPCDVNPPEELPGIAIHQTVIPTSMCGLGFVPGEPVTVALVGPGGREWTGELVADDGGAFEWAFVQLPRRLQGEYVGRATQGEISVERTIDVRFDSLTAAVVPRVFRPGRSTELVIAGGEAGQRVPVHLYKERAPEAGWDFIADVGPIRLDGNGQGRLELSSRRRDEEGRYMVVVDPDGARIGYWFVLGAAGAAP